MQTDVLGNERSIYVYEGPGTGEISKMFAERSITQYLGHRSKQVVPIYDASYFQTPSKLVRLGAILFPGGSAWEMSRALGEDAKNNIMEVLKKNKASYLGFCGGSYLISPFTYNETDFREILTDKFNRLVDKDLVGPAYPLKGSPNLSTARGVPVQMAGDSQPFYVWWNGGGYYKSYDLSTDDILCTYHEPREGKNIAALATTVSNSRIVVSHVHPETRMTSEELEKYCPNMNYKQEYLAHALYQDALFKKICRAANILNNV